MLGRPYLGEPAGRPPASPWPLPPLKSLTAIGLSTIPPTGGAVTAWPWLGFTPHLPEPPIISKHCKLLRNTHTHKSLFYVNFLLFWLIILSVYD